MTRTETMIANAEANGRACAKAHLGQIVSDGVPFELHCPYSRKMLRDAWQRGVDAVMA